MATKLLAKVSPLTVFLLFTIVFLLARTQSQQEIARVKLEAERLAAARDSIANIVTANQVIQARLRRERDDSEAAAALLQDVVTVLERERKNAQLTVRTISQTAELQLRLQQTFPELAAASWGVTTLPLDAGDTLGLEYFLVPAWFSETFIIDHQNAAAWREQKDQLLAVDSLRLQVVALQDSITRLEAQNAVALQTGYNDALLSCQDLSQRYVAQLSKPRFSLGSTFGLCLGAAGAGLVVGTVIRE
ncbi:MAG: hypothetical protein ACYSTY_13290 [Planctomycetota bacterium]|jgi:hypothetical protein